jgi:hypothetical protein
MKGPLIAALLMAVVLPAGLVRAQAPPAQAPPAQAPRQASRPSPPQAAPAKAAPVPLPAPEPINIRYEVVVFDKGGDQPARKVVTILAALGEMSMVRADRNESFPGNPLGVDVTPSSVRGGKVMTKVGISYVPLPNVKESALQISQNTTLWMDSGKPTVITEAADPISDRRIIVEVTATILR